MRDQLLRKIVIHLLQPEHFSQRTLDEEKLEKGWKFFKKIQAQEEQAFSIGRWFIAQHHSEIARQFLQLCGAESAFDRLKNEFENARKVPKYEKKEYSKIECGQRLLQNLWRRQTVAFAILTLLSMGLFPLGVFLFGAVFSFEG